MNESAFDIAGAWVLTPFAVLMWRAVWINRREPDYEGFQWLAMAASLVAVFCIARLFGANLHGQP